jgi:hypothetical protein
MVAGALSMAAGEFVSVSSQRDSERADLQLEEQELRDDPEGELVELTRIYEKRGVPPELAVQVAVALTKRDALGAHARDELGLQRARRARPLQASWTSALAFSAGAVLPLIAVALTPAGARAVVCVVVTLLALAVLGALGARLGGGDQRRATARVLVWGSGERSRWRSPPGSARSSGPQHKRRAGRSESLGRCVGLRAAGSPRRNGLGDALAYSLPEAFRAGRGVASSAARADARAGDGGVVRPRR